MAKKKKKRRNPVDKLAAKKAIILDDKPKSRTLLFTVSALVLLATAGSYIFLTGGLQDKSVTTTQVPTVNSAVQYTYPVNLFDDGIARHFEHTQNDISIRYFVLKSSDGTIRAAFDACDVCWPAGKGYYQDGDVMVCRNCGRKFESVLVNEVKGGCNPSPLKRHIDNGSVVITVADLLEGRGYFDFSKGKKS